jgi:hypothetical protein
MLSESCPYKELLRLAAARLQAGQRLLPSESAPLKWGSAPKICHLPVKSRNFSFAAAFAIVVIENIDKLVTKTKRATLIFYFQSYSCNIRANHVSNFKINQRYWHVT